MKRLPGWYWTILLSLFSLGLGILAPTWLSNNQAATPEVIIIAQNATATETLLPVTPFASRTPTATATLLPPPTFEPPTATAQATLTPSETPTQSFIVNVTVSGIQGLPSPTTENVKTCEPSKDWHLQYEVQTNETLTMIAQRFGTDVWTMASANCLEDPNMIRVGQKLLVPGDTFPSEPAVECTDYTLLQPIYGAWEIPTTGQITFNWQGPYARRNLLRLYPPDFDFNNPDPSKWIEYTFDLRQNETVDASELGEDGNWHWQVYPLNFDFVQICPESPLWMFNMKEPTPTPTIDPSSKIGP